MSNTTSVDKPILAARKISPLRQRMIDDMTVRNFAPNTILCYLKQVSYFAQHFGKSPDRLGPEEIRSYQIYLAKERKVGISSRTVAVSALRFLYHVTLKQDRVIEMIPFPKRECQLRQLRAAQFTRHASDLHPSQSIARRDANAHYVMTPIPNEASLGLTRCTRRDKSSGFLISLRFTADARSSPLAPVSHS
jgi:hypothetical protein